LPFAAAGPSEIDRNALCDVSSADPWNSATIDLVATNALEQGPEKLSVANRKSATDVGHFTSMVQDAGADPILSACAMMALRATEVEARVPQMLDAFKAGTDG
jgi:hypothetical protein